jgi:poly-gamma-glutamate synthesis protein (capsule biosynthesis protein)
VVTLANNHALDYGEDALLDTLNHLHHNGIATAGAGHDVQSARAPAVVDVDGTVIRVLSVTDHPVEYAAGPERPGVAYADIRQQLPTWLTRTVREAAEGKTPLLVSPHWGPNMTARPEAYVGRAAIELRNAGAWLVAGHSAHVFHGAADRVLYDLGDFVDDYATDPVLRNDLGLLWLLTIDHGTPTALEAVPLHVGYCRTSLATGANADWIRCRFRSACAELGTEVREVGGHLVVRLDDRSSAAGSGSDPRLGDA